MTVTADPHTLLHRAGIKGPVVLVGHAVGGLYATVYADRYWRDVAGLVLIDPPLAGDDEEDWRPGGETRASPSATCRSPS